MLPHVEHRQHKGLNNRAENSHRPTRRREKVMQKFKSLAHIQHFSSSFGLICEHFNPKRHLMKAADYRQIMSIRFQIWQKVAASIGC
jgi:putative transposase